MGRARGANAKLAGAFETTYGTPPATGFIGLPFVSSNLGAEQGLLESDLLGQGREPYDPTYDVVTNDGDVVVPVDVRYIGYWLKLLFGAPATTGSDLYTHAFSSGAATLPSMAIETQLPDVPSYAMGYGYRANQLRISMQRRGLLNATVSLVGKGENAPSATSVAGTLLTALALDRFAQATGEIKREGVTLGSIVSADVNFTNNLDKIETIQPDGEIEDADGGIAMATGSMTARFANNTLVTDATSQEPVELSWSWSFGEDFSLILTCPRVFLPRVKRPIQGPGGVQATFNWQASGEGGPSLIAELINDVASF